MTRPKDRSTARVARKSGKTRNDRPFLDLVKEETARKAPVRPSKIEIEPLNDAQREYDAHIRGKILTFGVGPAGTGKTWWAAARAAELYRDGKLKKIIITRPAQNADDEDLGFLPGELNEKYEPYFRPVREALEEILGSGHLEYAIKMGDIEARPLAFLRGASLKHCWIIADEMQNATVNQMKLLLTRVGAECKVIVNGDPNQCDLPDKSKSGLLDAARRLSHLKTVGAIYFTRADIVRSGFCMDVVNAYEAPESTPAQKDFTFEEQDLGVKRVLRLV